ncbi:MAG: ATP-binding domain-containing protein [Rhodanobacteraceae bacterium]|nr:ATP-binding domain-containing protein [Rhodanobacteraceae bacterium]
MSESSAPKLEGFATLRLRENFRTPQGLARELGELAPPGTIFRNPHEGTGLTMLDATQQFGEATVIAAEIRRLRLAGHELTDLIILELGGLSNLDRFGDRIGEHRLRRFTGQYSDDGEQLLTDGELDTETIGRFKGQQRAHVIVVGLNKDGPVKPRTHRALYVALTRATVGASVVLRRAPQNG